MHSILKFVCCTYSILCILLCSGVDAQTNKKKNAEPSMKWGNLQMQFKFSPENIKKWDQQKDPKDLRDYKPLESLSVFFWLVPQKNQAVPINPILEKMIKTKKVKVTISENRGWYPNEIIAVAGQTMLVHNQDQYFHLGMPHINKEITRENLHMIDVFHRPNLKPKQDTAFKNLRPTYVPILIHTYTRTKNGALYILVSPTPYATFTDSKGSIKIKDLPIGTWTFRAWSPRIGYVRDIMFNNKKAHWEKGLVKINIKPGQNDLGKVIILNK